MIFQRYASPLLLVDRMIQSGRFKEFVNEAIKLQNEDLESKTQWEYYLHKIFNMTYREYLAAIGKIEEEAPGAMSQEEKEATVRASMEIMNGFRLPQ